MAWKKRFRSYGKRFSGYASRARGWGKRNKGSVGIGAPFLAGVGIGLTDYDKLIPLDVKVAIACLPTGVTRMIPGSAPLVNIVRGMLIGDVIQARTGFNLGSISGNGAKGNGSYGI